jgi:single-strand DNA-binding protein
MTKLFQGKAAAELYRPAAPEKKEPETPADERTEKQVLNRIVLIGRLVKDPELRYTGDGTPVANFRIAVDRRVSKDQERQADFIDIVAWRQSAEFAAQYLAKGRLAAVDGRLQIRDWTAQDGTKRWSTEVVADNIQGLDRPQGAGGETEQPQEPAPAPEPAAEDDVEDPFADE